MILWHKLTPRGTRNTIKKYGSARAHMPGWVYGWLGGWVVGCLAELHGSWILGPGQKDVASQWLMGKPGYSLHGRVHFVLSWGRRSSSCN